MRYSVLPQASKLQHLSKLALWPSSLWFSKWLALTIGGPRLDHSGAGVLLPLYLILIVTVTCVASKGSTWTLQTVLHVPKKIQNVPNTMWRLLVTVKRLLRKTLWLKTTVLLWLRTSWWGVVWRLILALDLPTWWVPLCLLWVCRSECVWLYVGPNIIGF